MKPNRFGFVFAAALFGFGSACSSDAPSKSAGSGGSAGARSEGSGGSSGSGETSSAGSSGAGATNPDTDAAGSGGSAGGSTSADGGPTSRDASTDGAPAGGDSRAYLDPPGAYWQSSTESAPWVDKGTLPLTDWDNDMTQYISVDPKTQYQVIDGWGGSFNEKGWDALSALSDAERDAVIKAIYDPKTGLKFNMGRAPIGASDYADSEYSLDDSPGDYQMANFSIARDKMKMIPFIKAAMVYAPDLKVWGSPWSPPAWMKDNNSPRGGSVIQDAKTLNALALYFAKTVQAYRAEGIDYYAIHIQNEPDNGGGDPTCVWTGAQERDFIKTYLGPLFKTMNIPAEIWLSTIRSGDYNAYVAPVFGDATANMYTTGFGGQYFADGYLAQLHMNFPTKKVMMTETRVEGGNQNTWAFAETENWTQMKTWLDGWANSYMQWNIVLDQTGRQGIGGGTQNTVINVDASTKMVTYNPQYYSVKHFSYYVTPGAHRIATAGNYKSAIGFANANGEIVVEAQNSTGADIAVAIQVGTNPGKKIKATLPAHSFDTFRIVLN